MHDLKRISVQRITDEEVIKGTGIASDIAAAVALAFKIMSPGSSTPKLMVPLKSIINQKALDELFLSKNASNLHSSAIIESTLQLPPIVRNPKEW